MTGQRNLTFCLSVSTRSAARRRASRRLDDAHFCPLNNLATSMFKARLTGTLTGEIRVARADPLPTPGYGLIAARQTPRIV